MRAGTDQLTETNEKIRIEGYLELEAFFQLVLISDEAKVSLNPRRIKFYLFPRKNAMITPLK